MTELTKELELKLALAQEENRKLELELELQKQKNKVSNVQPRKYDTELCRAWGGYRDEFVAKEGEYAGVRFVRYSFFVALLQRKGFNTRSDGTNHFCRFSKIVEINDKTKDVVDALDTLTSNIQNSGTQGWVVSVKLDPNQDNSEYIQKVFASEAEIKANPDELEVPSKRGFNLYRLYNIKSQEKFRKINKKGGNSTDTDDGDDGSDIM